MPFSLKRAKSHNILWGSVDRFQPQQSGGSHELIVPQAATHEITVTKNGKVVWSRCVPVAANKE